MGLLAKRGSTVPTVFVSYSHRDRNMALYLDQVLTTHGARTFLDQRTVEAGDTLPERLATGVRDCDVFLLIWSADAAASSWVRREYDIAWDLRKRIVPYVVDGAPLPPGISDLVHVTTADRHRANADLLRAVFGADYRPPAEELFPGRWRLEMEQGAGGAIYDLELHRNGQLTGTGRVADGLASQLVQLGAGMLAGEVRVTGTWTHESGSNLLALDLIADMMGIRSPRRLRIQTTGASSAVAGQDVSGMRYRLTRLP